MSSNKATAPVTASKRKEPPSTSDEEEEEVRLDWRMEPKETLSDWTIEVVVDKKTHSTYHTHRVTLSLGSKKSEYFERLFQSENFVEQKTRTSRIELDELAAQAFPVMLDFMYSLWDDSKSPITHENSGLCTTLVVTLKFGASERKCVNFGRAK